MATPDRAAKPVPFTKTRQTKLLAYVAKNPSCSVKQAATHAGVKRWQVRELLDQDAEFKADYQEARGWGSRVHDVEQALIAVALDPAHASAVRAQMIYLKAYHPAYRDVTRLEHANADGKPFEVSALDFAKLSDDERDTLRAYLTRIAGDAAD